MTTAAPPPVRAPAWSRRDLLTLDGITAEELDIVFRTAGQYLPLVQRRDQGSGVRGQGTAEAQGLPLTPDPGPLTPARGVANIFFEDSTRTRNSFTRAAQLLGADVIQVGGEGSSMSKGETEIDTARNIEAMGVDALIVRHACAGVPHNIADAVECCVINAGDGRHEHPTQGLLDIFTLRQHFGPDLSGRTVAIVGDIANSRVVRSNIFGLRTLGAKVIVVGPPALAPASFATLGVEVVHDFDAVLPTVDVVMMLRVQFERGPGSGSKPRHSRAWDTSPDPRPPTPDPCFIHEYREGYALTARREKLMAGHAVVMHPGPINRGLELDSEVADGPRSIILQQVTHGVAIRMAVLRLLLTG